MARTPVRAATFDKISSKADSYQAFGWTELYPTAERMTVIMVKMAIKID